MANPDFLNVLGDAVGEVYEDCVDRLLWNIARYFRYLKPGEEPGGAFQWQAKKLAQFGQVNEENVRIIRRMLAGVPAEVADGLELAILDALDDVEPELRDAAKAGLLGAQAPPEADPRTMRAFGLYYRQSADRLDLVNTRMLESTAEAYRGMVSEIALELRAQETRRILNAAVGETLTGVESFNTALRAATRRMLDNGLTGFVDAGGHHWQPETYASMVMRSTCHNVSRDAFWERNEDYGNDLYLVSQHLGARPLCYPWQCKVISRNGPHGVTTDGAGNPVTVWAQDETSYGEPAGLFGINCGHHPELFIPGATMVPEVRQDEKENEKTYAESQKQRGLEREFRKARTAYAVAKEQGAPDAELIKLREKLKDTDAKLDRFTKETGRKRRREREYRRGGKAS